MFKSIDIQEKLIEERRKNANKAILNWVEKVFEEIDRENDSVLDRLTKSPINRRINSFNIDKANSDSIFHISQIKKICINYRLRFLDTKYFKGDYPQEVITKIKNIENEHDTVLDGFKIIAPSKLFELNEADDPLLFAPMGNGYYYLIHKWGKDLHPLRKMGILLLLFLFVSINSSFNISHWRSDHEQNNTGISSWHHWYLSAS